jgi:hypothetical protein
MAQSERVYVNRSTQRICATLSNYVRAAICEP